MMKPVVSYSDFAKLDLRVGRVTAAEPVSGSEKLYKLTVDLGNEYGLRTILAGAKPWYAKSRFLGRNFIFIANLEPRTMMGRESQGMMLAVDGVKPVLIPIVRSAKIGSSLC